MARLPALTDTRSLRILAANNHRCAVVDAPCSIVPIPRGACPPRACALRFHPPEDRMSFVVNDSRVESLSAVAAQHDDWIIQQAIALPQRRTFKVGPSLSRPPAETASATS